MGTHEYSLHLTMQQDKPSSRKVFKLGPHEAESMMRVRTVMDQEDMISSGFTLSAGELVTIPSVVNSESREDAIMALQADSPVLATLITQYLGGPDDLSTAVEVDAVSGLYIGYDTDDFYPPDGDLATYGELWVAVYPDGGSVNTRRVTSINTSEERIYWDSSAVTMVSSAQYFLFMYQRIYGKTIVLGSPGLGFSSIGINNPNQDTAKVKIALIGGMTEDA